MRQERAAQSSAFEREYGGSADAIRYHYDVGRDFYRLWLDESMTYSAALWADENPQSDSLAVAQKRKIDFHLAQAEAAQATSLLDIGCGWGATMRVAAAMPRMARVVGLTLSLDQADYVRSLGLHNADVQLESWVDHSPRSRYDSIISIGAFEHFAKPEDSVSEKIAVYRDFFGKCRDWLTPHGRMSLQSIAYGCMRREEASPFINNDIFPAADLPSYDEIAQAAKGILAITTVHNHRWHYGRTMEHWARNLRRRRSEAVALVGEEVTARYERFLTQSAIGFYMGKIDLLRIVLRPISDQWSDRYED